MNCKNISYHIDDESFISRQEESQERTISKLISARIRSVQKLKEIGKYNDMVSVLQEDNLNIKY